MPKGPQTDKRAIAVKNWILNTVIQPVTGYGWTRAMTEAGYSEKYANDQGYIVKAAEQPKIDKQIAKIQKDQRYNLEDWENKLQDLHETCRDVKDRTNEKGCVEMGIKLNGGFRDIVVNLNADIPSDPALRRAWCEQEIVRIDGHSGIIEAYSNTDTAIAKRF